MSLPLSPRSPLGTLGRRLTPPVRLRLVPRAPRNAPRVPFVVLVSLLLIGGVTGLLMFNTSMQQRSFTATALQQRATVLGAQVEQLQMRLDQLRDPQQLAARAERLGLVPVAAPAFLRLSNGAVLGDPQPATAASVLRIVPLPTAKPKGLAARPIVIEGKPVIAGTGRHSAWARHRRAAAAAHGTGAAHASGAAGTGTNNG